MSEVHLYVEDTGIGIPHSEQKMIFERFYKRSEFSQGVGLGLSICVLIVEKMGGRIELESEEGRGSRFTVVLPCIEFIYNFAYLCQCFKKYNVLRN